MNDQNVEKDIIDDELEDEEEGPQGFLDRVVNVFLDPVSLFKSLAKKPDFWAPLVLVIVINAGLTFVVYPKTINARLETQRMTWSMQADVKKMEGEEKANFLTESEKKYVEGGQNTAEWVQIGSSVPFTVLIYMVIGGIVYLISLIQGLDTSFGKALSVMVYSSLISVLGNAVNMLVKVVGVIKASSLLEWQIPFTSISYYLPDSMSLAYKTPLTLLDPFAIWGYIVMVIGLRYLNNCSQKAAILTVAIYLIITILFLFGSGVYAQWLVSKMAEAGGGGNVQVQVG